MLNTTQALLSQSLQLIEGTNEQEITRVWEAQLKLKCFPSQKGFSPPTYQSKSCLGTLSSQGFLDLEQTPRYLGDSDPCPQWSSVRSFSVEPEGMMRRENTLPSFPITLTR